MDVVAMVIAAFCAIGFVLVVTRAWNLTVSFVRVRERRTAATVADEVSQPARKRVNVSAHYPEGKARPVLVCLRTPAGETYLSVQEARDLMLALSKAADAATRGSAFSRSVFLGMGNER